MVLSFYYLYIIRGANGQDSCLNIATNVKKKNLS
jgi:hypothetical protein